jgi:hypothetical protein
MFNSVLGLIRLDAERPNADSIENSGQLSSLLYYSISFLLSTSPCRREALAEHRHMMHDQIKNYTVVRRQLNHIEIANTPKPH